MTNSGTAAGEKRRRIVALAVLSATLLVAMTTAVWFASRPADDDAGSHEQDGRAAPADPSDARIASGTYGVGLARASRRARGNDRITVPAGETNAHVRLGGADPATTAADQHAAEDGDAANSAGAKSASDVRAGVVSGADTRSGGAAGRRDVAGNVTIHVTAAESGEPVRDAVVVFTLRDAAPRDLVTDGNGRAVFPAPVGATAAIDVKARGRFRERRDGVAISSAETTVKIVLTRGVVVRGTVTGLNGRVAGATIRAVARAPLLASLPYDAEPRAAETTTTDRNGTYWLDCIPRGVEYELIAECDGFVPRMRRIEAQPDVDYVARCDADLVYASYVEGTVSNPDGNAVAGAWVYAFAPLRTKWYDARHFRSGKDIDELNMLDLLRDAARGDGAIPERARTDAKGAFRIPVSALVSSWNVLAMHSTAGRSALVGPLKPPSDRAIVVVHGRVRAEFELLTARGLTADAMDVTPWFPWEHWSVAQKKTGFYGDADMEEGPIAIVVSGPAGAPGLYAGRRIDAKRLYWRAQLSDPVVWSGTVVDDASTPVAGARVTADRMSAISGEHGEFAIQGVHPREWLLTASADGHPEIHELVEPGPHEGIAVSLPRDAPLQLRLKLPGGATAPTWFRLWTLPSKAQTLWDLRDRWNDRFVWNAGEVSISGEDVTDDRLAVFVPGYAPVLREFHARPGEPTDVGTIELAAPTRVAGQVVDETGATVPYASVCVRTSATALWLSFLPERWIDCDASGSFRADVPVAGQPCEILATATGFLQTPQALPAETTDPVVVVLGHGVEIRGRWESSGATPACARILGPGDTVYAAPAIEKDGTFGAVVPRRPRAVEIRDRWKSSDPPLRSMDVPASWSDGDVLLIP